MTKTVTRYSITTSTTDPYHPEADADPDGEWVKWCDVEPLLRATEPRDNHPCAHKDCTALIGNRATYCDDHEPGATIGGHVSYCSKHGFTWDDKCDACTDAKANGGRVLHQVRTGP